MTSQAPPAAPFARFSRSGFGIGLKSRPQTRDSNDGTAGEEEEWYIPYNGPYEAPREAPRRQKARDSWGDPVGGEDDDAVLAVAELHNRYGGYGRVRGEDEGKNLGRDRTHSVVSGGTLSSGEPSRASTGMRRRSTVSGNPPTVPSYINLGTTGGVGESPTPPLRATKELNRLSFASIFSFGSGRRSPPSPPLLRDRSIHKTPTRKPPRLTRPSTSSGQDLRGQSQMPTLRRTSSTNDFDRKSPLFEGQRSNPPHRNSPEASTPDDEDYYNTYYSTLIHSPRQGAARQKPQHGRDTPRAEPYQQHSRLNSPVSRQASTSPTHPHPYAYAFPKSDIPSGPPLIPRSISPREPGPNNFQQQRADPPRLTFTTPLTGNSNADVPHYSSTPYTTGVGVKQLKNSVSTPNLRSPSPRISPTQQIAFDRQPPPTFTLPKGKDRWLSAETWCDALLFPRPRLKVKQDENGYVGSGRIVSPPGTPLADEFGMNHPSEQGMVSRVLAHSRSLVDLKIHGSPSKSLTRERVASTSRALYNGPVAQDLRPPRPTSFAQDDLALLSPASSLSKVLAEGELLAIQRQQWQLQATKSFENKRSRSISRTRSKSLTQKGRREAQPSQTGLDFLAARAYLGNQSAVPVVVASRSHRKNSSYSATGTVTTSSSRPSHSHSSSLVKTLSKSSKSHSRGHSRTGSWSQSAIRIAKSTVAICGLSGEDTDTPCAVDESATGLEGALRREGTKFIRLADPAKIPVDKDRAILRYSRSPTPRVSPTPSGMTDSRVGIALSTPPLMTEESLDRDFIRLPAHPYAQGGLYSFSDNPTAVNDVRHIRGSDYAGPHPSKTTSPMRAETSISSRHKLPPHLGFHPYAQTPAKDGDAEGLVPQARSDSNIPPQSTMWAQLSPGVVREILPGDIQYSPFSPDRSDRLRSPGEIRDIIGVGESLIHSGFRSRSDSDAEIIEERSGTPSSGYQSQQAQSIANGMQQLQDDLPEFGPRAHREAVLYDARRPSYAQHLLDAPPGFSSWPKEQSSTQLSIPFAPQTSTPSPVVTSESSPHLSPRPLGSPNDLENFHDLFYKPSMARHPSSDLNPSVSSSPQTSSAPWDIHSRNRRTGSGLTSLARQLSEEFEQMALERERTSSQYSYSAPSVLTNNDKTQRPTNGSLRFVFDGIPHPESPTSVPEEFSSVHGPALAFKPSGHIPEDVESSIASSVMQQGEEEDDDTTMFRVGMVESVSTPPATDHRLSFMGQTADVLEPYYHSDAMSPETHARVLSGLHPPATEGTRSSYLTTSTLSRMSGLSDFPIPPRDPLTPRHMSLLTSYFDEALAQNELQSLQNSLLSHDRRLTFGIDQDAEDVAEALSSDSHA